MASKDAEAETAGNSSMLVNMARLGLGAVQTHGQMRQQGHGLDYTIHTADGGTFRVHRNYLACFSDYFYAIQTSGKNTLEGKSDEITLEVVTSKALKLLLDFLYCDIDLKTEVNTENIEEVLAAAAYLQIEIAISHCMSFLKENLDLSNAVSYWQKVLSYTGDDYGQTLAKFVFRNFDVLIAEKKYLALTKEQMQAVLKSNKVNVEEHELCKCVLTWVEHHKSEGSDNQLLEETVKFVRFALINQEKMASLKSEFPILTTNKTCLQLINDSETYKKKSTKEKAAQKSELTKIRHKESLVIPSTPLKAAFDGEKWFLECIGEKVDGNIVTYRHAEIPLPYPELMHDLQIPEVVVHNNFLVVCGGFADPGHLSVTAACAIFDPQTWRWEEMAPMKKARVDFLVCSVGDYLFVFGGNIPKRPNPSSNFPQFKKDALAYIKKRVIMLHTAEKYSFRENKWDLLPVQVPFEIKLSSLRLAQPLNGKIYFVGMEDENGHVVKSHELNYPRPVYYFNTSDNRFGEAAKTLRSFQSPRGTVSGNKMYVFSSTYRKCEDIYIDCYDPNSDQWSNVVHKDMKLYNINLHALTNGKYLYLLKGTRAQVYHVIGKIHILTGEGGMEYDEEASWPMTTAAPERAVLLTLPKTRFSTRVMSKEEIDAAPYDVFVRLPDRDDYYMVNHYQAWAEQEVESEGEQEERDIYPDDESDIELDF